VYCHDVITKAQNKTKPTHPKQTKHSKTEKQKHKPNKTKNKTHDQDSNVTGSSSGSWVNRVN